MIESWDALPPVPTRKVKTGWPSNEEKATAARLKIDVQTLRKLRAAGTIPEVGQDETAAAPPAKGKSAGAVVAAYAGREKQQQEREQRGKPEIPAGLNPFKGLRFGEVLGEDEAAQLRPMLLEAVTKYTEWFDDFISNTNRARVSVEIWSTMPDDEIAVLVDASLSYARKHAAGAAAVRNIAVGWGYVKVGVILAPRFFATMHAYAQNGGFALMVR